MSQTLGPQALRYFHDDMPPPPRLDEAKYRIFMTQKTSSNDGSIEDLVWRLLVLMTLTSAGHTASKYL